MQKSVEAMARAQVAENPDLVVAVAQCSDAGNVETGLSGPRPSDYGLSLGCVDALLGPPDLAAGEDLAAFRRLEDATAASLIDHTRRQTYIDIRCWTMAIWATRRYRRCREQKLQEALAGQILLVAPASAPRQTLINDLLAGRSVDKAKIDRHLAKARVSYDFCLSRAMAEIAADYEQLSRLADNAERRAHEIENHCSRREAERYQLALLRRRAFDAQALSTFD